MAKKLLQKKIKLILGLIAIAVIIILGIVIALYVSNRNKEPEIITSASLEKVINVSELSTFEAVYDGIAVVMNEKNPEDVDYYVSYHSKVKAGIDFDKVVIDLKETEENKTIVVTLPEITLQEPTVDIETLDYIFVNEKANNETVTQTAYKACIEDATKECEKEDAIYSLAKQNAENMIRALIKPFVAQTDESYEIEIKWGGAQDEK